MDDTWLDDDLGVPLHPLADMFDPGGWDRPGRCICGTGLPPQRAWHDAGMDWQHIRCPTCSTLYVDEEDFFAIYDPDAQDWDPEDESCPRCRSEREAGPGVADDTATEKPGPAHGDRVTRTDSGPALTCIDGPDAAGTPPISPERAAPGLEAEAVRG